MFNLAEFVLFGIRETQEIRKYQQRFKNFFKLPFGLGQPYSSVLHDKSGKPWQIVQFLHAKIISRVFVDMRIEMFTLTKLAFSGEVKLWLGVFCCQSSE